MYASLLSGNSIISKQWCLNWQFEVFKWSQSYNDSISRNIVWKILQLSRYIATAFPANSVHKWLLSKVYSFKAIHCAMKKINWFKKNLTLINLNSDISFRFIFGNTPTHDFVLLSQQFSEEWCAQGSLASPIEVNMWPNKGGWPYWGPRMPITWHRLLQSIGSLGWTGVGTLIIQRSTGTMEFPRGSFNENFQT